jgi:NADH:ubiquinone oxidoreductase subunit
VATPSLHILVFPSAAEDMLSRLSGAVKRLVGKIQKVEHVGTDRSGNKYFKRPDEIDGTVVEKRWIEFQGDKLPDPTTVPG